MKILINQMGYRTGCPKTFIVQDTVDKGWKKFRLTDVDGNSVYEQTLISVGNVANWHTGLYWTGDFSEFDDIGEYYLKVSDETGDTKSIELKIDNGQTNLRLISALTYYFKGQRDSGEWAAVDKNAKFNGKREGTHNIYGGWFDATGDLGIHMSHQTFTSYFNPQQLPFSVYSFFKSYEELEGKSPNYTMVRRHLLDEGSFGADSLARRYVNNRSFLKSVNRENAYSIVNNTRKIGFELHHSSWQFGDASTMGKETVTDLNYETSFRSGGGIGIAALAIAARHPYPGTDFTVEDYINIAKKVYEYLRIHNDEINNDGRTNILDEYCALYAALELYKTTDEYGYLLDANEWGEALLKRIHSFGDYKYFTVDKELPYFHPSDEGMPIIALIELSKLSDNNELKKNIKEGLNEVISGLLKITREVNNPFQYPRLTVQKNDQLRNQYFFPHDSAAAPWWQGENARIASLSLAIYKAMKLDSRFLTSDNKEFVQNQIDWILGKNPFDSTMMEGYGRNPIQYHFNDRLDFINAPGGVVNGITSGLHDEDDIEFVTKPNKEVDDNWRWAEQWIPHASWLLLLLSSVEM